jgi:hypothetical protein
MSWLDKCLAENVVDFSSLGSLQISRGGPDLEISSDSFFGIAPQCTRVHHLLAKECLAGLTVRNRKMMEVNREYLEQLVWLVIASDGIEARL